MMSFMKKKKVIIISIMLMTTVIYFSSWSIKSAIGMFYLLPALGNMTLNSVLSVAKNNCAKWSYNSNEEFFNYNYILMKLFSENEIIDRTKNCTNYFNHFLKPFPQFLINNSDSKVAMSFQVHHEIGVFEMLIALLFNPNNYYCIHLDSKASSKIQSAVKNIVKCYQEYYDTKNIFLYDKSIQVYWGLIGVLDSDLLCLEKMYELFPKWDYYLNYAGTELPAISQRSLQNRINNLNGESLVESVAMDEKYYYSRSRLKFYLDKDQVSHKLPEPEEFYAKYPFNLRLYKGLKNVVISRKFAKFILYDPVALEFHRSLQYNFGAEEHFYSTLIRVNVDSKTGKVTQNHTNLKSEPCIRFSQWIHGSNKKDCLGIHKNDLCIFSTQDIPSLINNSKDCLTINKFHVDFDPMSMFCLIESWD